MKSVVAILLLTFGLALSAAADVWKWEDAAGDTHFVDTNRPIYTWVDDYGKAFYSDRPDHADAISVQLVWVSAGSLDDVQDAGEERAEQEAFEEHYCERATEVYDSYLNAPQLYRTNEAGEREFLSAEETNKTIADTKSKVDEFCH